MPETFPTARQPSPSATLHARSNDVTEGYAADRIEALMNVDVTSEASTMLAR